MLQKIKYAMVFIFSLVLFACSESGDNITTPEEIETPDYADWTDYTHGKGTDPDYAIVFPQDQVSRFDIKISSENWQVMWDDMVSKHGAFGSSRGGGPADDGSEDPVFVPCSFNFNGIKWYQVGIRFKGNSSLSTAWGSGIMKLPLKLDFDEFEDDYPEITNQRFYGFKKLALSSGFGDNSLIREKVAADIFREAGIKAAQTSFVRVYVDYGEGSKYFGLYTIVEVIDDTMLENQFGNDDGNCYKPEGTGASFRSGTYGESYFEKKTNEDEADWSDVNELYSVLHNSNRLSNPTDWRNSLENILDTDVFLKWLAVNTTIQNWDTYGVMTHNYYLYNDPSDSKLNWIPWDNNESLMAGKQGGALSISLNEINSSWPLIRYLIDDESYKTKYQNYLSEFVNDVFIASDMTAKYQECHDLISPYVIGEEGEIVGYTLLSSFAAFSSSVNDLSTHANSRINVVNSYLNNY